MLKCVVDDDKIIGVLYFEVSDTTIYFGPFAVDPAVKGMGVGKNLLAELTRIGKDKGCTQFVIHVVNHRTDLLPMYKKRVRYKHAVFVTEKNSYLLLCFCIVVLFLKNRDF